MVFEIWMHVSRIIGVKSLPAVVLAFALSGLPRWDVSLRDVWTPLDVCWRWWHLVTIPHDWHSRARNDPCPRSM